jgi:hypothetical protein
MAVAGAVVTLVISGGFASATAVSDRLALYYSDVTTEQLPLTVQSAEADGWQGTVRCVIGRGRFYQKPGTEGPYPVMLLYSPEDKLVGLQVHTATEQPSPPWHHSPDGVSSTEIENLDYEHWRFGVYLVNPIKACGVRHRGVCPTCYG